MPFSCSALTFLLWMKVMPRFAQRRPPLQAEELRLELEAGEALRTRMPKLRQIGPSCGSTCLAMCFEYLGLPADPEIIEAYLHPYGTLDLGEVPAELARFAKNLGFEACHYSHGSLEDLAYHLRKGRTVIAMLNYNGGVGHIVNIIGIDRGDDGLISQLLIRNPWGRDEFRTSSVFAREWQRMRQTRKKSLLFLLPVFDCAFAVVGSPENGHLRDPSFFGQLHSAPVELMVAGMNGFGSSATTFRNGHRMAAMIQTVGTLIQVIGGLGSYVIGNLFGLNMQFWGGDLADSRSKPCSKACGHLLNGAGWALSMIGGLLATCTRLLTLPLLLPSRFCTCRDALRFHVERADDARLARVLQSSSGIVIRRQLHVLQQGRRSAADQKAAERLSSLAREMHGTKSSEDDHRRKSTHRSSA